MNWLILTILAYFFLAIVVLFDRYFLVGKIPNPKVYTFNIGILWFFLCLLLIPFGITNPGINLMILGLGAGLVRILAILFLTESIIRGEVSRAVPAVGGLLPIFSFFLFFFYFPRSEIFNLFQLLAFILLVLGSVMISLKKFSLKIFTFENLKHPIISAFLFALNFFLMKILFLKTEFLTGFFLTLVGGGLGASFFLVFSQVRESIFTKRITSKISGLFILGQILGGLGALSQFYAVSLAKPGQVPLINALEGIRYVFLLIFVFILSSWKPELLKEEMKGAVLLQKIIAVLLIGTGIFFLFLR